MYRGIEPKVSSQVGGSIEKIETFLLVKTIASIADSEKKTSVWLFAKL